MFILLYLHIAVMFLAIALHTGPQLLAWIAVRWGPEGSVTGVAGAYGRLARVIPVLFISGGLLGLLTGLQFHYDLLAPWLIIAYIGFAIAAIYASRMSAPTVVGLASPNGSSVSLSRLEAVVAGDALIVTLLIADMVFKPFS
jgi:hypothetical protein